MHENLQSPKNAGLCFSIKTVKIDTAHKRFFIASRPAFPNQAYSFITLAIIIAPLILVSNSKDGFPIQTLSWQTRRLLWLGCWQRRLISWPAVRQGCRLFGIAAPTLIA